MFNLVFYNPFEQGIYDHETRHPREATLALEAQGCEVIGVWLPEDAAWRRHEVAQWMLGHSATVKEVPVAYQVYAHRMMRVNQPRFEMEFNHA